MLSLPTFDEPSREGRDTGHEGEGGNRKKKKGIVRLSEISVQQRIESLSH